MLGSLTISEYRMIWIAKKRRTLLKEMQDITNVLAEGRITGQEVKCSVYLPTLLQLTKEPERRNLITWLDKNMEEINGNG